jgi:hypothetical protein
MYTLGTSAIKYVAEQLNLIGGHAAAVTALNGTMVAYVGTLANRDGVTGDPDHPPTFIAPRSVFIMVDSAPGKPLEMANVITSVTLLEPAGNNPEVPDHWQLVDSTLPPVFFNTVITAAGGFANAWYAWPRGNESDISAAPKVPGMGFFAKDTKKLYICQDNGIYTEIVGGTVAILDPGMMVMFPDVLGTAPSGYLRCNGQEVPQALYPNLFSVIGNNFGVPINPGNFVLPLVSNTIIKV